MCVYNCIEMGLDLSSEHPASVWRLSCLDRHSFCNFYDSEVSIYLSSNRRNVT